MNIKLVKLLLEIGCTKGNHKQDTIDNKHMRITH
jgi:hypothetical protein